jgi:hypothetical protein
MQNRTFGISLLLLSFAFAAHLQAQKYSNEFLSIGVGARAHGMANAQVANVDDVTSGYWNPAGLVNIKSDMQIGIMHAEWFGGIGKYDYAAVALPIPKQNRYVGFSFVRFGVDGIPNTLSLYEADGTINYNNVTTFSAADYAFMLHYAQNFEKIGLSIGATPKIVHRQIGKFATAWGFGVDLGAQYKIKNFQFGLLLRDITTTFNSWKFNFTDAEKQTLGLTNNEIPIKSVEITRPQIILGIGYRKDFNIGKPAEGKRQKTMGILTELDFQMTTDGQRNVLISADPISIDPMLGLELHYDNIIFLRSGINNFQRFGSIGGERTWAVQPNFGVGFRIFGFRLDYAITNLGGNSNVLYSHLVSARMDINYEYIKKAMKRAEIE